MDSNTNYVPTKKIFEIRKFYDTYYTDYCASYGPKIKLLFDLLAGAAYECACPLTTIDENTIEFTGSAYAMIRLYNKIMNCKDLVVECNMKLEDLIPNWVESPMLRFILEKGVCMWKDLSQYTVQFKKLN